MTCHMICKCYVIICSMTQDSFHVCDKLINRSVQHCFFFPDVSHQTKVFHSHDVLMRTSENKIQSLGNPLKHFNLNMYLYETPALIAFRIYLFFVIIIIISNAVRRLIFITHHVCKLFSQFELVIVRINSTVSNTGNWLLLCLLPSQSVANL